MNRGPAPGKPATDHVARARLAWGDAMPAEIEALASAAAARTASAVARDLGYSPAVVSQLLSNKYPGDVARVLGKVRGLLLGEVVECPVLGTLARNRCLDEQKKPFASTNSTRVKLFHACRKCPLGPGAQDR